MPFKRTMLEGNTVMWFSNPQKISRTRDILNRLWIIYAAIFKRELIGLVRKGKEN